MDKVIKKNVEVTVNIKIARMMLQVAGFHKVCDMSDNEVFEKALFMASEYGVEFEVK